MSNVYKYVIGMNEDTMEWQVYKHKRLKSPIDIVSSPHYISIIMYVHIYIYRYDQYQWGSDMYDGLV